MNEPGKAEEKSPLLSASIQSRSLRWQQLRRLTIFCILALLPALACRFLISPKTQGSSTALEWFRCPDDARYQCAYMQAPLNYLDADNTRDVFIALRKLPASCSAEEFRGSVITEPGGPGISGHANLLQVGPYLSDILENKYDVISLDPRGVNLTLPSWKCYQGEPGNKAWSFVKDATLPINGRNGSLTLTGLPTAAESIMYKRLLAEQQAMVEGCQETGDSEMIKSSSTAFLARDLARLVDLLGEEKLNYWGFSYGTVVGNIFAAMFPEKVGRFVLDGNVDTKLWTQDWVQLGRVLMADTNLAYKAFSRNCARTPSHCALATSLDAESDDDRVVALETKIGALLASAAVEPHVVPVSSNGPGLVDAGTLHQVLFRGLYTTVNWPRMAEGLAKLEAGEARDIYEMWNAMDAQSQQSAQTFGAFPRELPNMRWIEMAMIGCLDSKSIGSELNNTESRIQYARDLQQMSVTGELWAWWHWQRSFCTVEAYEAYYGPWSRQTGLRKLTNPILRVNNLADPVTPAAAARTMSEAFGKDSGRLLLNDGTGHCTYAQPSLCIGLAVNRYFLHGELPEEGKVCKGETEWPFKPLSFPGLNDTEAKLLRALEGLAESWKMW